MPLRGPHRAQLPCPLCRLQNGRMRQLMTYYLFSVCDDCYSHVMNDPIYKWRCSYNFDSQMR